jgi:molybdopterin-guanine dinucleotide biosynthesis protein A
MNINPFEIPCVILSGGKSSRMGEDKSLLPFSSSNSLIEFQFNRLKPYFKYPKVSFRLGNSLKYCYFCNRFVT